MNLISFAIATRDKNTQRADENVRKHRESSLQFTATLIKHSKCKICNVEEDKNPCNNELEQQLSIIEIEILKIDHYTPAVKRNVNISHLQNGRTRRESK